MNYTISCFLLGITTALAAAPATGQIQLSSPDASLKLVFHLNETGAPRYSISRSGTSVILESKLGLVRDDQDFSRGMELLSMSEEETVKESYEILNAKRRHNSYHAKRRIVHLKAGSGGLLDIIFQLSNDGVAFRYHFPETSPDLHSLKDELSSFRLPPGSRAWLQPMSVAKSGWMGTNPSYEEYYEKNIPVGTPSRLGAGWIYPALFRTGDTWVLLSETALGRNYCGTRLRSESPLGEYSVGFPDPKEAFDTGTVNPQSTLPWSSPWRVIVVGGLGTVAESMLGVDLADKPAPSAGAKVAPGKASWSWPLLGDRKTDFETQKRFIDYAAEMGWRYTLIDALWDKQIGYEKVKELTDYARTKGVAILLWYNSAGAWNTAPQTPRNLMLTKDGRLKEFEKLKAMGVAGLKIDFFGGDGQSMIAYYHDILQDSAPYGFAINFHGATLPRGWQRTYPHLMTMEAIRGLEFVTFEQANADQEPTHAAMLPFARNVFDPMDFTPMVLDRINKIERRTSSAFELALSVLFTSGIQHYAEIPEGLAKAPAYVRDFLKQVPNIWDDVKFIAGEPGEYAVLARKGNGHWTIAGINATRVPVKVSIPAALFGARGTATLITDGNDAPLRFSTRTISLTTEPNPECTLQASGGFVLVLD